MILDSDCPNSNPWADAIKLEMQHIANYEVFLDAGYEAPIPKGHKNICVHLVFDVKHDGRHRARLVAVF